jgi:D-amino-acid dehydrogenase
MAGEPGLELRAMKNVVVLGAGMAGVGVALSLQRRGWSVVMVDQGEPGRETSYGNAGLIQGEAFEPYPMPRDLRWLLDVAFGRTNDVRYDLMAMPQHVGPLLRYWWHSAPRRFRAIAAAYASIIAHAIPEHEVLVNEAGAGHLIRRHGFREMFRSEAVLDAETKNAERLHRNHGVAYRRLTSAELVAAEPALHHAGAGALHWLESWAVTDPGGLVRAYADRFMQAGGTFVHGDAASLEQASGGWRVATADGPVEAGHVVVALGPWSPELMGRFGYRYPMVRKRGYHRHYRMTKPVQVPLRDADFGYLMAPMAAGLRITTGAELVDRDAPPSPLQLVRAEREAAALIDLGAPIENTPWSGTRPCMPDMLPVIGEAPRHKGLWMHFGHGHQGFTLGPATGRMLAEMMSGEPAFADATPFSPARWR